MKNSYSDNQGYYEWDAFKGLAGKLHEGSVKSFVDTELRNDRRISLQDYADLFRWTMENKENEHLLNDAIYICNRIYDKIRTCNNIKNKEHEYSKNKRRMSIVNDKARLLWESEPENRSFLKSLIKSAYLLHDYEQLGEIFTEVVEKGSAYDIAWIKHHYARKRLPANAEKLMSMHRRRQSFKPSKGLERIVSQPEILFLATSYSIPDEIKPAFLEYQREKRDMPPMQEAIENSDSFVEVK